MNNNLKKAFGLVLIAGALIGCISVISYINNSKDEGGSEIEKPNNENGSSFNFKSLEFVSKIFDGVTGKSDGISNEKTNYKLEVNTNNINTYIQTMDFKNINDFIYKGAQGLASENNYDLKSFDVYSIRKTIKKNESDSIKNLITRYRYNVECEKSADVFSYYTYTSNSSTKVIGNKANLKITSIDVDIMLDLQNDKKIDVFEITPNGLGSTVRFSNADLYLSQLDFEEKEYGASYFVLSNDKYIPSLKMYDDYIERLSFVKNDIFPSICYSDFFTSKECEISKPEEEPDDNYVKDSYTNRENNILRLIHNDLDKMVGKKYGLDYQSGSFSNKKNPLRELYDYNVENGLKLNFKDNNNPVVLYRAVVQTPSSDSKIEFLLQFTLSGNSLEYNDDSNLIKELKMFLLVGSNYSLIYKATGYNITYYNGFNNSSLTSFASDIEYAELNIPGQSIYYATIFEPYAYIFIPDSADNGIDDNASCFDFDYTTEYGKIYSYKKNPNISYDLSKVAVKQVYVKSNSSFNNMVDLIIGRY